MRVQVNLATRPFVELRPFFLRLRLLMAALGLVAVALFLTSHLLAARAERQQLDLDRLRNQTIAAQQSRLHVEQRMRDPVNSAVLDRAHRLNTLFLRKSFSWTAVMMDLEDVLPMGVQITSIEPAVSANGDVVIRLRVAGERDRAVQLVRNLERSRRFLQPRLSGESAQTREGTAGAGSRPMPGPPQAPLAAAGVEFEILANYNPLPAGEPYMQGRVGRRVAKVSGDDGQGETLPAPAMAFRPGRRASRRDGYPPYGVTLQPYNGPAPQSPQEAPHAGQGVPQ